MVSELIFCQDRKGKIYTVSQKQIEASDKYVNNVEYVHEDHDGYAKLIREANHEGICCYHNLDARKVNKFRWKKIDHRTELAPHDQCGIIGLTVLDRAPFCGVGIVFEPKKSHVDAIERLIKRWEENNYDFKD